ncbi:MAG TPA: condensation domain-containing protein [Pseudonocardiaceae bacterium]|nr:condensation domain-containing protein [Pseudonocardiaceae bacterium]
MSTSQPVDVEDVYPLTPMQNGILFHTLRSQRSGPYLEQFVFDMAGDLDGARFGAAWTAVVNRHPALRSAFVWEGVDEPVQVVVRGCVVPVAEIDLTDLSHDDAERALADFLAEDRAKGVPITEVPLMRLTLVRHAAGTVVVWTLHHLVMDGWSMPITVREVAATYRAMRSGVDAALPTPRPFHDFVTWLAAQPTSAAKRFWRERLTGAAGFDVQPLLPGTEDERRGSARGGRGYHDLSPELSSALASTAQQCKVTLNSLFQTAWALLLARVTGTTDVLFGMTVSGRPADIADADGIVGVFINTVPQRVSVDESQPVRDLLRDVQRRLLDSMPFQQIGLTEIQACSDVPVATPLFDSIVVFENYPGENPDFDLGDGAKLVVREIVEDADYPLTLTVLPRRPSIRLQLLYDAERFTDETTTTLLGRFEVVLETLVEHADGLVSGVDAVRPEYARRLVARWNDTEPDLPVTLVGPATGDPAGLRVHLLDHRLEPVPAGVRGAVHLVDRATAGSGIRTEHFGRHLPDGTITFLDLTATVAEPAPSVATPAVPHADQLLGRPVVQVIADLWAEVLGRRITGPESDFFSDGGDSLAAVRLVGRLRMTFETELDVNAVFEARTLRNVVALLDQELGPERVDKSAREQISG